MKKLMMMILSVFLMEQSMTSYAISTSYTILGQPIYPVCGKPGYCTAK